MKRLLGVLAMALAACGGGTGPDPARYGTRTVFVEVADAFLDAAPYDTRRVAQEGARAMRAVGPEVAPAADAASADFVVRVAASSATCAGVRVSVTPRGGAPRSRDDLTPCLSDAGYAAQLRFVVAHTLGRAMGMEYVCASGAPLEAERARALGGACSPVGLGPAIMNPRPDATPRGEPTALDAAEYARTH